MNSIKGVDLSDIYSENVAAKIFQVAERGLKQEVDAHPSGIGSC